MERSWKLAVAFVYLAMSTMAADPHAVDFVVEGNNYLIIGNESVRGAVNVEYDAGRGTFNVNGRLVKKTPAGIDLNLDSPMNKKRLDTEYGSSRMRGGDHAEDVVRDMVAQERAFVDELRSLVETEDGLDFVSAKMSSAAVHSLIDEFAHIVKDVGIDAEHGGVYVQYKHFPTRLYVAFDGKIDESKEPFSHWSDEVDEIADLLGRKDSPRYNAVVLMEGSTAFISAPTLAKLQDEIRATGSTIVLEEYNE